MTERQASFADRARAAGVDLDVPVNRDGLVVDLDSYEVRLHGRIVDLTARQVEMLAVFVATPGRVWSRDQLTELCWQLPARGRRVDVQLCRIRNALGVDVFRNVRERGWALRPLAPA